MALPSTPEQGMADVAGSTLSQSSGLSQGEATVDSLKRESNNTEKQTSKYLDASSPLRVGRSVDVLKSLSRNAETDNSKSPESSAPSEEKSPEQTLETQSDNAETDTSASVGSSGPAKKFSVGEDAENGLSDAEMDFLLSESSRRPKKEPSGEYLESLSRSLLDVCLNLKDPDHPIIQKHQSVDFRNKHDALPKASNRKDHHDNLQKHLAEQTNFHVEIFNTSSEVDDSRGRATVYLWYEITGLAHGLEREAVAVLSWERKQGTWMVMKHIGMRGPAGFC